MIQKLFSIIYFRKSSNTSPARCHEVRVIVRMLSQIGFLRQVNPSSMLTIKGLMPTRLWAAPVQPILHWLILIWMEACLTRTTLMLSSRNCIEKFIFVLFIKVRIKFITSILLLRLLIYIFWGTTPKYKSIINYA